MVSDPRGELSGAEEQIDVCEESTEKKDSPNQSNHEIEKAEPANSSAEESRTGQSEGEERSFIISLYGFMKERGTPIERIPHLGFKQINLWKIYKAVETLGGYDSVTARRLWKNVYDELGGSPGSTSAATCTRRHYERLVLPFERHRRGEEDKPLPASKPRKQYKRSEESKSGKPEGKKRRRTAERDDSDDKLRTDHLCDGATFPHSTSWSLTSKHLDCNQGSSPDLCPQEKPLLQTLSPALVISPLEKKKRLAQASLSEASHQIEDGSEPERPTVIQLSHSSQSPPSGRRRNASDGSPVPLSSPSASISRTPSPYSVSSEDCVTSAPPSKATSPAPELEKKQKPATFGGFSALSEFGPESRVCKPLSRYPNPKELATVLPLPRYHDFLLGAPIHVDKVQRNQPSWAPEGKIMGRQSALRIPIPASLGSACWAPSTSSFSKVLPRNRDPWRPVSLQPLYKPHTPPHPQHPQQHQPHTKRPSSAEAYLKKIPSSLPKNKMMVSKTLPTQQYLIHPQHSGLPVPYLLPAFNRPGGETVEQLKTLPLHPVLLPAHVAVPPSQTHPTLPLPVGASFAGPYDATLHSYPYSVPVLHPHSFGMASLQPF